MKKNLSIILIIFFLYANSQDSYFPGKNNWDVKSPSEFNYDSKKIQEAIDLVEMLYFEIEDDLLNGSSIEEASAKHQIETQYFKKIDKHNLEFFYQLFALLQ